MNKMCNTTEWLRVKIQTHENFIKEIRDDLKTIKASINWIEIRLAKTWRVEKLASWLVWMVLAYVVNLIIHNI